MTVPPTDNTAPHEPAPGTDAQSVGQTADATTATPPRTSESTPGSLPPDSPEQADALVAPEPEPIPVWPGTPYPLGATYDGVGTNFSLFSEVAEAVDLCLIDRDGHERRIRLDEVDGHAARLGLDEVEDLAGRRGIQRRRRLVEHELADELGETTNALERLGLSEQLLCGIGAADADQRVQRRQVLALSRTALPAAVAEPRQGGDDAGADAVEGCRDFRQPLREGAVETLIVGDTGGAMRETHSMIGAGLAACPAAPSACAR